MLKPEYGDWYPWLTPGVWYRAVWLRELVVRQRQAVEPRWEAESRVPNDVHFTFRGGRSRPDGPRLTRWTDFARPRALGIPRPSGAQPRLQVGSPGGRPA
jgi:hypothetical protein